MDTSWPVQLLAPSTPQLKIWSIPRNFFLALIGAIVDRHCIYPVDFEQSLSQVSTRIVPPELPKPPGPVRVECWAPMVPMELWFILPTSWGWLSSPAQICKLACIQASLQI